MAGRTAEWTPLLLAYLPGTVMWALVTPLVIALALQFPLDRDRWPRSLLIHLPAALAIAVAEAALYQLLAQPSVMRARVPSLMLQPLVENALRHGVESRVEGGTIEVAVWQHRDQLHVEVRDDGCGLPFNGPDGSPAWSEGVGLRNTRDRLRHLYGDAQDLSMQAREGGGAVISIVMPLRLAGADLVGRRPRAEADVA